MFTPVTRSPLRGGILSASLGIRCLFLALVSPSDQDTADPLPCSGFWSHVVVT